MMSHLVSEHEGDQAGEVLASFIIDKQAQLEFLLQFGGIEGFLQEQVKLYGGHQPDCARELNIVKVALKEVAKITQALVTQQRPTMNFGTPTATARPSMNFGADVGSSSASAGGSSASAGGSSAPVPQLYQVGPAREQPAPARGKQPAQVQVAQGLHMPAGRSEAYSLALPPRWGDGIAESAPSRSDIRDGMARLANTQRTAAIEHASAHPPPPSSLVRRGPTEHGRRGEMLGPQHVAEELARVQRRIATQQLRDESASEGEGEGGDEELGLPMRGAPDAWDGEMPQLDRGWQHTLPSCGAAHLVGWPVCAVFPTGGQDQLRWHYGGFIFDTAGGEEDLRVRVVFPDGFEDWWDMLPDPAFAFKSQLDPSLNERATSAAISAARGKCGM